MGRSNVKQSGSGLVVRWTTANEFWQAARALIARHGPHGMAIALFGPVAKPSIRARSVMRYAMSSDISPANMPRRRVRRRRNPSQVDFSKIRFGYKSAEAERRHDETLLLEGFFEKDGSIGRLLNGPTYLVLGYKGSGKSAIAEHLELISRPEEQLFVDTVLLRDFPFEQVPELVPSSVDVSVRNNLAWSLLLLLRVFESVSKDQGAIQSDGEVGRVAKELRALNLLPKKRFRDLVLTSKQINLSVALPKLFSASMKGEFSEPVLALTQVKEALRSIITDVQTASRHVLVLDGLDEIFTSFESRFEILASLVHAVDSINADFAQEDSCAKILLLCRNDLFERLPSPNVNKLRDFAMTLDWYHSPQRPAESQLIALATHRARLAGYEGENVLADFLPTNLKRGQSGDITNTYKFLLDHTRHTPRDFLQLLEHVRTEVGPGRHASNRDVFDGLRSYSTDYFLPEIKDELSGYFSPSEIDACFRLIGGLRRREFTLSDLETYASDARMLQDVDLREAMRVLFDCSAIGNVVERPDRDGSRGAYMTFKYRNRSAAVNYGERFILHRGVWKALNLT